MARSVEFNQFIRPACLPETYGTGAETAVATGWGRTDYRSQGSDILMKVVLELYPDDECRQLYYAESHSSQLKYGIDVQTQFCAGSRIAKKDVCQVSASGNHPKLKKILHCFLPCVRRETRAVHCS